MKKDIKELIIKKGMTLTDFSKEIGTYPSALSLWLNSGYPIPRKYLKRFTKVLKVSKKKVEHAFRSE